MPGRWIESQTKQKPRGGASASQMELMLVVQTEVTMIYNKKLFNESCKMLHKKQKRNSSNQTMGTIGHNLAKQRGEDTHIHTFIFGTSISRAYKIREGLSTKISLKLRFKRGHRLRMPDFLGAVIAEVQSPASVRSLTSSF